MMDADSFINNMNSDVVEEERRRRIKDLNNEIDNLNIIIGIFEKLKRRDLGDLVLLSIIVCTYIFGLSAYAAGLFIGLVIFKSGSYIGCKHFKKKLNSKELEKKEFENTIEKHENNNEKVQNDKDYFIVKEDLLTKIDDLDKDDLLAIRTIIDEYTTNKDIPSQVGNIAQFLTETQVGDIDIEDTSLYNEQVDEEAKGKARSYHIEHK